MEDDFYKEFGQTLKQQRERIGLTQGELAAKVQLGRTSVTNIEQGRQHVPLHMLLELAKAVGVDPMVLLPAVRLEVEVSEPVQRAISREDPEVQTFVRNAVSASSNSAVHK